MFTVHRSLLAVAIVTISVAAFPLAFSRSGPSTDPWTASQTVQPADFAKELSASKSAPTVLFVGYPSLFHAGHIKGAQFHGTGSSMEGLAEIKKWADPLPRATNLVIYCGCCPMEKCPNVRPAFALLQEMGFTHLRVLILPTSFAIDWAEKDLPYDKG
jgi:thiosulfate/3-mercaptopyruvate sulfurtransferase